LLANRGLRRAGAGEVSQPRQAVGHGEGICDQRHGFWLETQHGELPSTYKPLYSVATRLQAPQVAGGKP